MNKFTTIILVNLSMIACEQKKQSLPHYNMVGKVDQNSAILQTRLTTADTLVIPLDKDVVGQTGYACFELAKDASFSDSRKTDVQQADSTVDFIIKSSVNTLDPNTLYYYRTWTGHEKAALAPGRTCTFKTLPEATSEDTVQFVVLSCMNFEKFFGLVPTGGGGDDKDAAQPATGTMRASGFPGFKVLQEMDLHFWVGNGDNVYYDKPYTDSLRAKTQGELRAKWHRQFSVPTLKNSLDKFATHWQVDDHDYRFNDADTTNSEKAKPSHQLGVNTFREQLPVIYPDVDEDKTYYTLRPNKFLQIWFVEGRAYRSPNRMTDGPEKSIWGADQKQWLKSTLAASEAPFKLLISPTPMVGPDDAYKVDNHTNQGGFRHERDSFFTWLEAEGIIDDFYIITGDRHWQYHSLHPTGINEFSSGAFVAQNARMGRQPGDQKSTDPEGNIKQPFLQGTPAGGFVYVQSYKEDDQPVLEFQIRSEYGDQLYKKKFYPDSSETM